MSQVHHILRILITPRNAIVENGERKGGSIVSRGGCSKLLGLQSLQLFQRHATILKLVRSLCNNLVSPLSHQYTDHSTHNVLDVFLLVLVDSCRLQNSRNVLAKAESVESLGDVVTGYRLLGLLL